MNDPLIVSAALYQGRAGPRCQDLEQGNCTQQWSSSCSAMHRRSRSRRNVATFLAHRQLGGKHGRRGKLHCAKPASWTNIPPNAHMGRPGPRDPPVITSSSRTKKRPLDAGAFNRAGGLEWSHFQQGSCLSEVRQTRTVCVTPGRTALMTLSEVQSRPADPVFSAVRTFASCRDPTHILS